MLVSFIQFSLEDNVANIMIDWLIDWLKDRDITVVANEAKDNVKYLSTLDKFFGPLGKCTPVKI